MPEQRGTASFRLTAAGPRLQLAFMGDWTIDSQVPPFGELQAALAACNDNASTLALDARDLGNWDSLLLSRILQCSHWCLAHRIELDYAQMPEGVRDLLRIATAVKPAPERATAERHNLLQGLGNWLHQTFVALTNFCSFLGSLVLALAALLRGRSNTRLRDFLYSVDQAGPKALGIVTLISVLVGMILAYMGAIQLRQFGAQIYVANLVAIGMVREMAALMTGIIMAGRTGAAYAAQLGTMQTNEEIDAIETMGMSPMEFLVSPRFLALIVTMPLLCMYSNILGILGGALVAAGMDVSLIQYMNQVQDSITWADIGSGLIKSVVYAALIAIAGCQAGLQCGRNSAAVGQATTSAVVRGIVYIIVADSLLNIIYDKLGL